MLEKIMLCLPEVFLKLVTFNSLGYYMGHWPSFTDNVYSPVKDLVLPPDSITCFMSNHRKFQVYPGLHLPQLLIQLTAVYKPV